jgi:hypothetical protein
MVLTILTQVIQTGAVQGPQPILAANRRLSFILIQFLFGHLTLSP